MEPIRFEPRNTETVVMTHCEPSLHEVAREAFESVGLHVVAVESAADLPERARTRQPAFLLVDESVTAVAYRDGVSLLEELKTSSYTSPIPLVLLLPPGSPEPLQLDALQRGADECFARPASSELLVARLKGLARRYAAAPNPSDTLTAGDLTVDLKARKVSVAGRDVILTRKEFDLLNLLMRRRGIVVYTTHLYHAVWGYGESSPVDAHTVKVHVSSLRGKLGTALGRKIVNLPGLGYRFDD